MKTTSIKLDQATNVELNELSTRIPFAATGFLLKPNKGKSLFVALMDVKEDPTSPAIIATNVEVTPAKDGGSEVLEWMPENTTKMPTKTKSDKPNKEKPAKTPLPKALTEPKPERAKPNKEKVPAKKAVSKTAAKKAAKAEKPAKVAKEKAPPRENTGFVALVRSMLLDGKDGVSKYTVGQMYDAVIAKFPNKSAKSVKRIAYNISRLTKTKWKSSAVNTGYLNRIDELLFAGELTTRLIGESVSVEFGKPVDSAKSVVRARMQVLKGMGHKLNVPLEDTETRQTTYLPQDDSAVG